MPHSNAMMFGPPPPPPQLPNNGATHPLQTTQSGNHINPSGNAVNSINNNIHQNHLHPHQQQAGAGPTPQLQHSNYGARQHPAAHHGNGLNGNRTSAVHTQGPSNSCFSNPAGVLSVAMASQPQISQQVSGPPPPYHFQPAPNNGVPGPTYVGSPHSCNLQGIPQQIPFSTAGNNIGTFIKVLF